jgi:hypothetical protein
LNCVELEAVPVDNEGFPSWVIVAGIVALCASCAYGGDSTPTDDSASVAPLAISRTVAVSQHWDEIKEYADGSETVQACSESGCYDLDADISSGIIETLHFPNGGYLMLSADIESDGSASDADERGRLWSFTLDMDSAVVDEAVREWARATGRALQ